MNKQIFFLLLMFLPLSIMAQDNDPFGGGSTGGNDDPFGGGSTGGGNDPFGNTTPAPTTPPSTPNTEPINAPTTPSTPPSTSGGGQQSSGGIDPFSSGGGSAGGNDPFTSGGSAGGNDFGSSDLGLSTNGGGDLFDNLVDTLTEPLVPEFPWEQKTIKEKAILSTYDVDESDVFWAKTVYREIDVREKINHPFAYPRAPFMTVMLDVLNKDESIKVYKEDVFSGREFSETSSWTEIESGIGNEREETIYDYDEFGNETTTVEKIVDKFRVGKVKRFKIKEVWYFDKKHSRMNVRIMGIAPMMDVTASDFGADVLLAQQYGLDGANAQQQTLFWVYYPDIRESLARYETFNPLNDALRMSWDDLLTSRYFGSYITKVSNPLDKSIKDYTRNSLEALYESEEIKEEIFNFEHDLWTY